MEQGSRSLLIILCVALALGALVVGINPSYRHAMVAIWKGQPADSPIWKSNAEYYPDVALPALPAPEAATAPVSTEIIP